MQFHYVTIIIFEIKAAQFFLKLKKKNYPIECSFLKK